MTPGIGTETRDEQRKRVLTVAQDLFAEYGFDDVTMADIATEADVARATVFNYFGSKHSLIEGITETVLDFYRAMLDDALADETTPTPAIMRTLCDEMGAGIEAHRDLFRDVFREIARIQLGLDVGELAQRANAEATSRFQQLVRRGQERREFSDRFSVEALSSAFHALINGTITNWLYHDPSGSLSARLRDAVEVLLSPIEQRPRPTKRGPR